jgi:hypothetical protein
MKFLKILITFAAFILFFFISIDPTIRPIAYPLYSILQCGNENIGCGLFVEAIITIVPTVVAWFILGWLLKKTGIVR